MIEVRDFDKDAVVVYTDEQSVATRLSKRKNLIKEIPYEQVQHSKKRVTIVGLDLYFPKSAKKGFLKLVRV